MKSISRGTALAVLCATALAGCSGPEVRSGASAARPPPARDVLAEVRADAAMDEADGLEVAPLREAVIEDLRERAERFEAQHDYAAADAALEEALRLVPEDPELMQWRAELALVRGAYDEAVRLADASYERGPRLGGLCRRNWNTIRLARELAGYPDAAVTAQRQGARCTVEPPVRM